MQSHMTTQELQAILMMRDVTGKDPVDGRKPRDIYEHMQGGKEASGGTPDLLEFIRQARSVHTERGTVHGFMAGAGNHDHGRLVCKRCNGFGHPEKNCWQTKDRDGKLLTDTAPAQPPARFGTRGNAGQLERKSKGTCR